MRLSTLALLTALLAAPAARAQTTFTELDLGIPPPEYDQGPEDEYYVASLAPGDIDGDGDFDLRVLATYVDFATGEAQDLLTLYRNDGPAAGGAGWTFTPTTVVLPSFQGGITGDLAWADYDADGDLDVVVASVDATVLYRNDGGALVATAVPLPLYDESAQLTPAPFDRRSLSWADVDNDGDLDLLVPSAFVGDEGGLTALLRNDGPGGPGGWTFTDVPTALPPTFDAQTGWGDADNDGDLDLLLQENETFGTTGSVQVFRNDAGTLVGAAPLLTDLFGTAEWTDVDSDGDLDVLVAGTLGPSNAVVRLYRNDAGTYTSVPVIDDGLPGAWVVVHTATAADVDGDGDVDLLVTGVETGLEGVSVVYANEGGAFVHTDAVLPAQTHEDGGGSLAWFDLDGDGDLDHLVSTRYYAGGSEVPTSETRLFRNDAVDANAPPTAPAGLTATVTGSAVVLVWDPATDDGTAAGGLSYGLAMSRAGSDIVSPMSRPSGGRLLPEPGSVGQSRRWTVRDLPPGTYTWTVQAVDTAFNGGPFAAEGTFTVGPTDGAPGSAAGAFGLSPVAPNPTSGLSVLTLTLGTPGPVAATVYDPLGRRVAILHDGVLTAGTHALALDASALAPGVYVVRAITGAGESVTRRLVVSR